MTEHRKINQAGLDLIKHFEGRHLRSYLCPADVWTIGYGHTKTAGPGMKITEAEAEQLLRQDLADAERAVERYVNVPLNDNQFAALVSFVFNCGAGAFRDSTLLRLLNDGDYFAVPIQLARWNKAGGKVLKGLTRRRKAEGELWGTPAPKPAPVPKPHIRPASESREVDIEVGTVEHTSRFSFGKQRR